MSEEIIKNCKRMNILLNRCVCTVTVTRAFNILVFLVSVGFVRERDSE